MAVKARLGNQYPYLLLHLPSSNYFTAEGAENREKMNVRLIENLK
jgi:hypothetical protein